MIIITIAIFFIELDSIINYSAESIQNQYFLLHPLDFHSHKTLAN